MEIQKGAKKLNQPINNYELVNNGLLLEFPKAETQ